MIIITIIIKYAVSFWFLKIFFTKHFQFIHLSPSPFWSRYKQSPSGWRNAICWRHFHLLYLFPHVVFDGPIKTTVMTLGIVCSCNPTERGEKDNVFTLLLFEIVLLCNKLGRYGWISVSPCLFSLCSLKFFVFPIFLSLCRVCLLYPKNTRPSNSFHWSKREGAKSGSIAVIIGVDWLPY